LAPPAPPISGWSYRTATCSSRQPQCSRRATGCSLARLLCSCPLLLDDPTGSASPAPLVRSGEEQAPVSSGEAAVRSPTPECVPTRIVEGFHSIFGASKLFPDFLDRFVTGCRLSVRRQPSPLEYVRRESVRGPATSHSKLQSQHRSKVIKNVLPSFKVLDMSIAAAHTRTLRAPHSFLILGHGRPRRRATAIRQVASICRCHGVRILAPSLSARLVSHNQVAWIRCSRANKRSALLGVHLAQAPKTANADGFTCRHMVRNRDHVYNAT
jgi:hypothetical protein